MGRLFLLSYKNFYESLYRPSTNYYEAFFVLVEVLVDFVELVDLVELFVDEVDLVLEEVFFAVEAVDFVLSELFTVSLLTVVSPLFSVCSCSFCFWLSSCC